MTITGAAFLDGGDAWGGTRIGVPIADADPFELEVHPAVAAPGDASPGARTLPPYVAREHDRWLSGVVTEAVAGTCAMATLVGDSSTGKTRACWEAVTALPEGWHVWHPLAADPARALLDAVDVVGPRTVVWLNEAQRYLLEPAVGTGREVAVALRGLLSRARSGSGPVLVLATLWPEHWNTLTAHEDGDVYGLQRELLTGVGVHKAVPRTFDTADLAVLNGAGAHDARLRLAAAHASEGEIAQFLAGAPYLLARYEHASPGARALLQAAMDYRRMGHPPALPLDLLAEAAEGYFTDREWDALGDDWLEQALAYCAETRHGVRGPLTRTRPRPTRGGRRKPAAQPGYVLADYLEQHGRATRRFSCPPASFWDAPLGHAGGAVLRALGFEAETRLRLRHAARCYQAAVDAGHSFANHDLARVREALGDHAEAERWACAAVAAGVPALRVLAEGREERGDHAGAERAARLAAENGDGMVLRRLGRLREKAGRRDDAERLYAAAAEAGDVNALPALVWMREDVGDRDGAERLARSAAERGLPDVLRALAWSREDAGDTGSAELLYQAAVDAGDPYAARHMLRLRGEPFASATDAADDDVTAHAAAETAWPTEFAGTGTYPSAPATLLADPTADPFAARVLAQMRELAGEFGAARRLYQAAVDAGDTDVLRDLARLRERVGDLGGAARLYQSALEAGHAGALHDWAGMCEDAGDLDAADRLAHAALDGGDDGVARYLVRIRNTADARHWEQVLRFGLDADGTVSRGT
ncbi:tetratricopeptide repeat protein [Yinghuangia seranimata]|uniref:tetratricopeptide repeat protein n=1 Tax=Yinghuangia seranimata TaxID=408067 RepID=UPI00248B97AA|nr:hypothetical protein [Yinghuangia seranimata]MDI2124895.1 hypothetical protein [Yinghuangia seranimata]